MRQFQDIERRWSSLFDTSIGVDLRQAIRDGSGLDPCEDGLRSVCWRAFLLYGPLSQASWTKKLAESRSAYTSLRDHFLRHVNHPDDVFSAADPLADDDNSPWSSMRQDESIRQEIFQDVTRCMQDNYFFREPTTQKKLLDILFIYAKLNPDTGYRQGMHELLAPVFWVVTQDAVDSSRVPENLKSKDGIDFMLNALDRNYIEHDTFSIFCAIMQTAKSFYEMGENRDSAMIVTQSDRIHNVLLAAVDPDLAHHLQVIGVLPQIYSIRWIRLLFGREFDFKDVLKIWDLLFAESLTLDIIEMTCVAMLLRAHWELVDADYTTAITKLTRFELPRNDTNPRDLVKDAVFLTRNMTLAGGAAVIQRRSGHRPDVPLPAEDENHRTSTPPPRRQAPKKWSQQAQQSPARSPARFTTPQKQLENIFQEVSGTLQKRTEGWSKTVRGAVGEVRRNMNSLQTAHSRTSSTDVHQASLNEMNQSLRNRVQALETRNKALSRMLDGALESLRACKPGDRGTLETAEDSFNMALARIQFVSVYLGDSEISIPADEEHHDGDQKNQSSDAGRKNEAPDAQQAVGTSPLRTNDDTRANNVVSNTDVIENKPGVSSGPSQTPEEVPKTISSPAARHQTRPSLADSSFSFMLGENRHRSSFVSSVSDLPEQRRGSASQPKPDRLRVDAQEKPKHERSEKRKDDDGFTLSSLN